MSLQKRQTRDQGTRDQGTRDQGSGADIDRQGNTRLNTRAFEQGLERALKAARCRTNRDGLQTVGPLSTIAIAISVAPPAQDVAARMAATIQSARQEGNIFEVLKERGLAESAPKGAYWNFMDASHALRELATQLKGGTTAEASPVNPPDPSKRR